jgi:hypothetical protein
MFIGTKNLDEQMERTQSKHFCITSYPSYDIDGLRCGTQFAINEVWNAKSELIPSNK